jgi:hypothetical protein
MMYGCDYKTERKLVSLGRIEKKKLEGIVRRNKRMEVRMGGGERKRRKGGRCRSRGGEPWKTLSGY